MKYCPYCASELHYTKIDVSQRLVCSNQQCSYVFWNNPVPVVAALVKFDGKYIFARNVQWPEHIFSVISGYLEAGETPEQAVLREVGEELGLTGEIVQHLGNYTFVEKNQLILGYEVIATGTISTNHEIADYKLLSGKEIAAYDFGPLNITQQVINDWKSIPKTTI